MASKNKMNKWTFTSEELKQQFERASQLGEDARKAEPRAKSAVYDGQHRRLVIEMMDRSLLAIPVDHIQGLSGASPSDINKVEISGSGNTLQWEELDLYFSVAGLAADRFGTSSWMAELGRKGGKATTEVKAAASRENGRKGGRPPTVKPQRPSFTTNFDSILVDVPMFQPEIDMLGLILSGQSQQPLTALIEYKDSLNSLECLTIPLHSNLSSVILPGAGSSPVISAKVEGVEENYYDATFPIAA